MTDQKGVILEAIIYEMLSLQVMKGQRVFINDDEALAAMDS